MQRLVLGCGPTGYDLVTRLVDRPGSLVVLTSEERAETLRGEGIDARAVDTTDPVAIRTVAGDVDSVVVAPEPSDEVDAIARAARTAYPDAFVLAHTGAPADSGCDGRALADYVDEVIEPAAATNEYLGERIGERGVRTRNLVRLLRRIEGTVAVVTHDNPDPDAIAAAVALKRIANSVGTTAEVCYYGEINHQENRALVNLLEFDLRTLDDGEDVSEFDAVALVDHSQPGVNDGLPEETPIDIVIDHHPPRAPIDARFVDLRSDVGSTSTLLVEYLEQLVIAPGTELSTALLYGIRTDTSDFSREVSPIDFEAAATVIEAADYDLLQRIQTPSIATETMEHLGEAIRNRQIEGEVLTTCVGELGDRDALAQAADYLLGMEGVTTTFVFGYTDEMVYASARARGTDVDLGETLRDAFDLIGSAGGHGDMAGAQIPVGMLLEDDEEDRGTVIEEVVTDRFFDSLGIRRDRAAAAVYADFFEAAMEEE